MRFVALALIVLAIPLVHMIFETDPKSRRSVLVAIGFLPFVIGAWHLNVSIISWAMWPGYVKGMLVSLLDAVAIAVLLSMPRRYLSTPFVGLWVAYIAAAALATFNAEVKQASFFYVWQLVRMLLVFLAVSRIATQPKGTQYIINGLAIGILLQATFVLFQKLQGVAQASGTMGHQNSLGMATHFALFPCLALLLAGRRDSVTMLGFVAAVICAMLTGSRATIGLAVFGILILLLLSVVSRPTTRKGSVIAVGLVAMLATAPIVYSGLSKRLSSEAMASSDSERDAFNRAAWLIIDDHPMGIGANEYVVTANTGGYSARAGVTWSSGSRGTNVHNTYLLMTAELGYLGGAAYLAFMLLPTFAALRFSWQNKGNPRGELALGFAVAFAMVALHCLFEWIYVTEVIMYLHAICLGMAAGLLKQQQNERVAAKRSGRRISSIKRSVAEHPPSSAQKF